MPLEVLERPAVQVEVPSEADLFCELAEHFKRPGTWTKGAMHRSTGQKCLLGGIEWVIESHPDIAPETFGALRLCRQMTHRLLRVIDLEYPPEYPKGSWKSLEAFNDAPRTTKGMILKVLRLAGDCAKEG